MEFFSALLALPFCALLGVFCSYVAVVVHEKGGLLSRISNAAVVLSFYWIGLSENQMDRNLPN
jgi:hypothetical protein